MEGGKGGREGGADTELKTKTPHVNVGNNEHMYFEYSYYGYYICGTWIFRPYFLIYCSTVY